MQGRGGLGIKAMKLADARGSLVGAMVVTDADEVLAVKASGQVTRSAAADVPAKGRDTMGVKFVTVADGDSVVAIARNAERDVDDELLEGGTERRRMKVTARATASTRPSAGPEGGRGRMTTSARADRSHRGVRWQADRRDAATAARPAA